jgi:predicted NBD/HSP70 family sugar kinase
MNQINHTAGTTRGGRQGQSLEGLRNQNIGVLLSAIWGHAPVSRADLSRLTGLAPSSITRLIRELEESGLIQETGKGESSGGRQPVLIAPNPNAGLIANLDMSGSKISGGIFDAANQLRLSAEHPYTEFGGEAVKRQLLAVAHEMLDDPFTHDYPVLGFGISVPGEIDMDTGAIVEAYNLRLRDFPLRQILMDEFGLPVYIEVDTYAAALAEKHYGAGQSVDDLIYMLVSTGIGFGIIMNGKIYQGKAGMSGFIGHIIIDRNGPMCLCGKRGCLEAIAGRPALMNSARRLLKYGRDPLLADIVDPDPAALSLEHVAAAAEMGSAICQEMILGEADDIAYAISLVTTILDINFVIVGGEVAQQFGSVFFDALHAAMDRYRRAQHTIDIVPAGLEREAFLKGISMLTLHEMLGISF